MTCTTEVAVKQFMLSELAGTGPAGSWGIADFSEQYNDLLLAYGATDSSQLTDQVKLRALARVFAWQKLVAAASADYDFQADGGDYKRSQVARYARLRLEGAERAAAAFLPAGFSHTMTPAQLRDAQFIVAASSDPATANNYGYQLVKNVAVW